MQNSFCDHRNFDNANEALDGKFYSILPKFNFCVILVFDTFMNNVFREMSGKIWKLNTSSRRTRFVFPKL